MTKRLASVGNLTVTGRVEANFLRTAMANLTVNTLWQPGYDADTTLQYGNNIKSNIKTIQLLQNIRGIKVDLWTIFSSASHSLVTFFPDGNVK